MESFDLEAFRENDGWPDERWEPAELGLATGDEMDKNPKLTIDNAIAKVKRRIDQNKKRKFSLGQTVATRNAVETLSPEAIQKALQRHSACDWGDVCAEDKEANNQGLQDGDRLVSIYHNGKTKFYVITEADRSVTTVLLPEDY